MSHIEQTIDRALELLAIDVIGGGISMSLHAGAMEPANRAYPELSAMAAGLGMVRAEELRSELELHLYIDCVDEGQFKLRLERLEGIAPLTTMPDATSVLAVYNKVTSWKAVRENLRECLSVNLGPNVPRIASLTYRKDKFAVCKIDRNAEAEAGTWLWYQEVRKVADPTLRREVAKVVFDGLKWGAPHSVAPRINLWFYPDPNSISAIYLTVTRLPNGCFLCQIEDRFSWPWKQNLKPYLAGSEEEVAEAVAGFFSRHHAFAINELKVYFNHRVG